MSCFFKRLAVAPQTCRLRVCTLLLTLFALAGAAPAADYFVSPDGDPNGDGSIDYPWDLQTALSQPAVVQPGDNIWMRGGTYAGTFISNLNGSPGMPITVRSYPGEWAVLDKAAPNLFPTTLQVNGSFSWFWGFEITNSDPTRDITDMGSNPSNGRAQGITMENGTDNKLINLVVHDSGDGIADNNQGTNDEIYGNLIYHNGWLAPDRGHGQGIYAQNTGGYKQLLDNILFSGFNQGIQIYGSPRANLNNFDVEGNIVFNTGVLESWYDRGILVGGNGPCLNPVVNSNYGYYNPYSAYGYGSPLQVGYGSAGTTNPVVTNNYLSSTVLLQYNQNLTLTGNTFVGAMEIDGNTPSNNFSDYPGNTNVPFGTQPTGVVTFVRPNKYEAGRANIAIFNWDGNAAVDVDVSSVLAPGSSYAVQDAQNFFGPPVTSGIYSGGTISIPMTSTTIVAPVGTGYGTYFHTDIHFGTFILLTVYNPPPQGNRPTPNSRRRRR